ncbi:MAG: serine hydrolase [Firmicutes bacterium]|nr:serine hydrolase [Bacillota bacterium]
MNENKPLQSVLDAARAQLAVWNIASASIAVVKDGETLFAGAIGTKDHKEDPADGLTLYPIASCSKAFTATALGLLATEGKLDFDTPIREYMPDFRLNDDYATEHLTIRDFLSHRSGLPRHEFAWYGTGFSRPQLMRNLKYLPLNAPVRYRWQYSNFNYLIAGALIEAVSGMPFEEFLLNKLLKPLGMDHSKVYGADLRAAANRALPFDCAEEYKMGEVKQIPYYESPAESEGEDGARVGDPTAAAGCVVSCAEDMVRWLAFNLNRGKAGDERLVSEELMDLIATPHMFLGGGDSFAPQRSSESYGLGWSIYQYRGRKMVEHGGNINGFSSTTSWLPDDKIGVFVSVNQNASMFGDAIAHSIIDALLGEADTDWYERLYKANEEMYRQIVEFLRSFAGTPLPDTTPSHPLADYAGTYEAPGYRRVLITCENEKLTLDFNHFMSPLKHFHYDVFATEKPLGEFPSGLAMNFGTSPAGKIDTVSLLLGTEQDLAPIVFRKKE